MTYNELNNLYLRIAEELDISETLFERAVTSYTALGEYIDNHWELSINVYTQGSFMLGTVIRPLNDEDEYDLDLVCEVHDNPGISPRTLKLELGEILRNSQRYSSMLEEKKRCWRIAYSDRAQFHIDITPAIPDYSVLSGIQVTNKLTSDVYSYVFSNPKGYSAWFDKRKKVPLKMEHHTKDATAGVEPVKVENNSVKLPLQRAIQVLKRHRDKFFEDDPEDKPISIIITTLAARAYTGAIGVYDAVRGILETMDSFITLVGNQYTITNPSNEQENFAERWNSEPKKALAFFRWLRQARNDLVTMPLSILDDFTVLENSLGEIVVNRAVANMAPVPNELIGPAKTPKEFEIQRALVVSHRQKPPFRLPKHFSIKIGAKVATNDRTYEYVNNGRAIPKGSSIDFSVYAPPNLLKNGYTVKWLVVNTGFEASQANCLRGGFETEVNTTKRHESTAYHGTHFVQAFLLKRGQCVAMSREFIVNVE